MNYLNLACGPVYITNTSWTNVDIYPADSSVLSHDLLKPLPFQSCFFDVVYSSHFLEHLHRRDVQSFLSECKRVLKPGATIRLVLPDSEEMFSTFLSLRSAERHPEADYLMIEIIDQCVRTYPGGELGAFFSQLVNSHSPDHDRWLEFVTSRIGRIQEDPHFSLQNLRLADKNKPDFFLNLVERISGLSAKVHRRIRYSIHKLGLRLLLPEFRRQNVSFAGIGERHCWLWDFHQLKTALDSAGFVSITRCSHVTSSIANFPFVPLDSTTDGSPRKGISSMFIEAVTPS